MLLVGNDGLSWLTYFVLFIFGGWVSRAFERRNRFVRLVSGQRPVGVRLLSGICPGFVRPLSGLGSVQCFDLEGVGC
jgi:hypothetical protein